MNKTTVGTCVACVKAAGQHEIERAHGNHYSKHTHSFGCNFIICVSDYCFSHDMQRLYFYAIQRAKYK